MGYKIAASIHNSNLPVRPVHKSQKLDIASIQGERSVQDGKYMKLLYL